ncbi:hypothetical protein DAPK24_028390 [Pichia kluyveri]|uniref:Uncharacterized protein n=1 Tax=Pichia kluyveri TaxID=36015 RepID=A0AAV5R6I7_PICKL|nr:hypothetical protein DAPK24_028390 [Pichia kluyveri]
MEKTTISICDQCNEPFVEDTRDSKNNEDIKDTIFDDFEKLFFSDYININDIHKVFLETVYSRSEEREANLMNRIIELESENNHMMENTRTKEKNEDLVKDYNQLVDSFNTIKAQFFEKDVKLEILKKYEEEIKIELLPIDIIHMLNLLRKINQPPLNNDNILSYLKIINESIGNIALNYMFEKKLDAYICAKKRDEEYWGNA